MKPKKKETSSVFFRLKIRLEVINTQEENIISFPIFSGSQAIAGKEQIISTYKNLGTQLENFIENNLNHELFFKKINHHNFIV